MDIEKLRDEITGASRHLTHFVQWWPDVVRGYGEASKSEQRDELVPRYQAMMDQARADLELLIETLGDLAKKSPTAVAAKLHLAATEATTGSKQRAVEVLCEAAAILDTATANAEEELVTIDEIAAIAGVTPKTVRTPAASSRPDAVVPKAGRRPAKYRYSELRKWAISHWPARSNEFPATFAEAKKKLGITP